MGAVVTTSLRLSNPGFEIIIAVKEAPVALTATRLPSD
jgi:hypothetical protein